jgi:hypothetical protein
MNRLNLLFFALLISYIHNFYSEFNIIFLQSFLFLFFSELIIVKIFNRFRRNQPNQTSQEEEDDSTVSDIEEDFEEDYEDKIEDKAKEEEAKEDKAKEEEAKEEESKKTEEVSEETEEESNSDESKSSSDEPVDIKDSVDGIDVNQMEILRLLNNYESLGDSGLMELKNKMLELDKLVEFYKNDTKKAKN